MYDHFPDKELQCKCGCGKQRMDSEFMRWIILLRKILGFPLPLSSAYRCRFHPDEVGSPGAHTLGLAVDILCGGKTAILILAAMFALKLLGAPFYGLGIKQHGDHSKRFIHIDGLPTDNKLGKFRPTIWSYKN